MPAPIQAVSSFHDVLAVSGTIGDCQTCVNYEPNIRHCALLDIWLQNERAEEEGECEQYQPDPHNN